MTTRETGKGVLYIGFCETVSAYFVGRFRSKRTYDVESS